MWAVHPHTGVLFDKKKGERTMNRSQQHFAECEEPDISGQIRRCCFCETSRKGAAVEMEGTLVVAWVGVGM